MPTIIDNEDRFIFANLDGSFTVWKGITYNQNGNVVGPGYIGRAISRLDGTYLTEGFVNPQTSCNDPRIQGVGLAAWHHYRDIPNEPDIWNKGWEMKGNLDSAVYAGMFGIRDVNFVVYPFQDENDNVQATIDVNFVDSFSASEGKRIMIVRYQYLVEPSNIKLWVSFTSFPDGFDSGPPAFIKEPKVVCGIAPNRVDRFKAETLDIFGANGSLLEHVDLKTDARLQDPTKKTLQVAFNQRARMRFYDTKQYWNFVGRSESHQDWEGGSDGLDRWARNADSRSEFDSSVCAAYCKQGGAGTGPGYLTRKWEVAKRAGEPQTLTMFHAWEGGSGLPDCLCCAKAFVAGERYTAFFSISRNDGWIV